jgi:hypothetical protein
MKKKCSYFVIDTKPLNLTKTSYFDKTWDINELAAKYDIQAINTSGCGNIISTYRRIEYCNKFTILQ